MCELVLLCDCSVVNVRNSTGGRSGQKIKKQTIMLGCYLRVRHTLPSSSTGSNRLMQKHKWYQ